MNEERKRGRKDKVYRAPCLVSEAVAMEGKGPYRIYDPGGAEAKVRDEAGGGSSYRQLLEENSVLRERMKGLKSLGDLLEESQTEASRLRQRVEELVRDNEALKSSSFATSLCMGGPIQAETQGQGKLLRHPSADQREGQSCLSGKALQPEQPNEGLLEFEVVNMEEKTPDPKTAGAGVGSGAVHLPQENLELASQLQRLESSFSIFAEESNPNQLLAHLGRMAVEFHHLSSKVQKNEQRTSLLQTLCEQLRQENNELRKKMEEDLQFRNRDLEQLSRRDTQGQHKRHQGQKERQPQLTLRGTDTQREEAGRVMPPEMGTAGQRAAPEGLGTAECHSRGCRQENQTLKELVTGEGSVADNEPTEAREEPIREEPSVRSKMEREEPSVRSKMEREEPSVRSKMEREEPSVRSKMEREEPSVRSKMDVSTPQKSGKAAEKTPTKPCDPEVYEKKIKLLEKQRKDVLEVNKQWDIQWNSMKSQFEQKITDLRQRLADSQKAVLELEAEREQRQRDYDKKLLLAKSKIENVQGEKECLNSETTELKQKVGYLQDQLLPLSKQREYQEKEIQRLNRALEEALNLHPPPSSSQPPGQGGNHGNHGEGPSNLRKQELLTQIAVLKEQVKIFEEDFRKERSDRERMNEEKEDLRRQVERLQGQMTNLTNQLHQAQNECQRERTERCKLERLQMQHHKQGFPWQSSFPQPRASRGTGGEGSRPPPENADQSTTTGFGKRERQNIDPGKH